MNSQSTLVGLFKEVYGTNIVEAWGFMAKLASKFEFVPKEMQPGNLFHQPVDVQFEHGISMAKAGDLIGTTSVPFLNATAGQMQDGQIAGAQMLGRSQVSYEAIARSANSAAAFKQATQHIVRRLSQSMIKRLEIQLLHGARGIGTVAANPTQSGSKTVVITITDETWSAGIWAGLAGCPIDIKTSDFTTNRQVNNNNTTTVSTTVSAIDTVNKTVSLLTTGDNWTGIVAGDVLFFGTGSGTTAGSEMYGLDAWSRIVTGATYFNISATTYDLWRGNIYGNGGNTGTLSFAKLLEGAGMLASYNMFDDLLAIVPPKGFEVLNTDIAALRQYDVSYQESKAKAGHRALVFNAQTGPMELMSHAFQKDGLAHLCCPRELSRVGATDVDFITRQGSEDKLVLESATTAGSEMRCYSNQALWVQQPRHTLVFPGLTY